MKQKTRYNIRLAEKKDIIIRQSSDIEIFNQLMKLTGERNEFGIHQDDYYRKAHQRFSQRDMCQLLIAYYQDNPLAALILFYKGSRAWYFYGASGNQERNRMPAYLLQFEAMKTAKEKGCEIYDLWGIPDFQRHILRNISLRKNEGLWSVYRFKRGFGGSIKRSAGVFKILKPIPYQLYLMAFHLRKREDMNHGFLSNIDPQHWNDISGSFKNTSILQTWSGVRVKGRLLETELLRS